MISNLIAIYLTLLINSVSNASQLGNGNNFLENSSLNKNNANKLNIKWKFELQEEPSLVKDKKGNSFFIRKNFESIPLYKNNLIYVCSPLNTIYALNPKTGKIKWTFKLPSFNFSRSIKSYKCRGLAYWENYIKTKASCSKRIFTGTMDGRLVSLDAETGNLCSGFGGTRKNGINVNDGIVDIRSFTKLVGVKSDDFYISSAPLIFKNQIILGGGVVDNHYNKSVGGAIRSFDVISGKLNWTWEPTNVKKNVNTTPLGSPNSWAPLAKDESLGLVYVPMGNPSPDYFGGKRGLSGYYGSSIVAINASGSKAGKVEWFKKLVNHDLWDYDIASQPLLINYQNNSKSIPALVVGTKMGFIYIFDRRNGQFLTPINFKIVNTSNVVAGETPSKLQLFPLNDVFKTLDIPKFKNELLDINIKKMESIFSKKTIKFKDYANTFETISCSELIEKSDYFGAFTAPSTNGSVHFPGNIGGVNWGGISFDPNQRILILNQSRIASYVKMIKKDKTTNTFSRKNKAYNKNIRLGEMIGSPYKVTVQHLTSQFFELPCNSGPWGSLEAIKIGHNNDKSLWKIPLGSVDKYLESNYKVELNELKENYLTSNTKPVLNSIIKNLKNKGLPNSGGTLILDSGIVVVSSTPDKTLRLIDLESGKILNEINLPADGISRPLGINLNNKTYIFLATGSNSYLIGKEKKSTLVALTVVE